ncbi:MAG: sigma-70 family RNA polymerase sigma factor [Ruminococcaceae bacterium]|nr:sigma-70 family RNA polymerase sigma factor [Oscillospiraceae bacterium]
MLLFYLSLLTNDEDKEIIIYIYERYYSYMAYTAARELGNKRHVEDIVHTVMLTLIEMIERIDYSDKKKLLQLCILISKRKAIDFKRKKFNTDTSTKEYHGDHDEILESPEDIVISREGYERLKASFDELDDIYKEVCRLRFLHGMSDKEIANLLGVSEAAVSMRIFRARKKLAELLKKENYNV